MNFTRKIILCLILLAMNNISVFAEEMNLNHIEDNDLAEEI